MKATADITNHTYYVRAAIRYIENSLYRDFPKNSFNTIEKINFYLLVTISVFINIVIFSNP